MHESQLGDPYVTPKTQPTRRPFNFLVIGSILALLMMTTLAAGFMVWSSIRPQRVMIDRAPPIRDFSIEASRRPVDSTQELPPLTPGAAVGDAQ
ncbi:MAG: hypothetical protein SFV81_17180 [Pirellulaceae bacterium]|nr:hypothetical protein [Pirellulaceae bacterium]